MCGLTGVAIHPDADHSDRTTVAVILNDLLLRTQNRGRHATGLAAYFPDGKRVETAKRAETATAFVKRREYELLLNAIADGGASHAIGHTRYATQGAAELDENAHPFTFGGVTGAHNGIIENWRDIERDLRKRKLPLKRGFQVDSEAAFALLAANAKSPQKALEKLEGYFALTWLQGASLYMARSTAPLTLVYVKAMRALFWNSEERILKEVLEAHSINISDERTCSKYDPTAGKIYRYTPALFNTDGTNVAHCGEFKFHQPPKFIDYSKPSLGGTKGGYSTRRRISPNHDTTSVTASIGTSWAKDDASDLLANTLGSDKVYSFPELTRKLNESGRRIIQLERRDALRLARILQLENQMRELRDYVGLEEALLDAEEESEAEPYRDALQLPLITADLEAFTTEGGRCEECGFASNAAEPLLERADGSYAHARCIARTHALENAS